MTRSALRAFVPLALAALVATPLSARAGNDGLVPQHDSNRGNVARSSAKVDEKIGNTVPMDLILRDENDNDIALRDAIAGKPTILVPVYYRCPMLCTKVLNGVLEACRQMPQNYSAGEQFTIVVVSMDPKEHAQLAKRKKDAYLNGDPANGQPGYGRANGEAGWRFLTGDVNEKVARERLATLLDAIGYHVEFDKMVKEYDHPTGIVILSPHGKITRYFYGIGYDGEFETSKEGEWGPGGKPQLTEAELRDRKNGTREFTKPTTTLRLSLIEANDGKGGSLIDKAMLVCYRYDKLNQGFALNVLTAVRIGGVITLAAVVVTVLLFLRRERRKARALAASNANGANGQANPNGAPTQQSGAPVPTGGTA